MADPTVTPSLHSWHFLKEQWCSKFLAVTYSKKYIVTQYTPTRLHTHNTKNSFLKQYSPSPCNNVPWSTVYSISFFLIIFWSQLTKLISQLKILKHYNLSGWSPPESSSKEKRTRVISFLGLLGPKIPVLWLSRGSSISHRQVSFHFQECSPSNPALQPGWVTTLLCFRTQTRAIGSSFVLVLD